MCRRDFLFREDTAIPFVSAALLGVRTSAYKVFRQLPAGTLHGLVVVGAEVVLLARHQPLGRIRRAVRAAHHRHLLDALALG